MSKINKEEVEKVRNLSDSIIAEIRDSVIYPKINDYEVNVLLNSSINALCNSLAFYLSAGVQAVKELNSVERVVVQNQIFEDIDKVVSKIVCQSEDFECSLH